MARYQGRRVRPRRYKGRRVLPPPPWRRPLLLFLTAALLVSGGLFGWDVIRAHRERSAYRALAERVHTAQRERPPVSGEKTPPEGAAPDTAPLDASLPETSPYEALALENPDFAGWLSIPDTALDYPVMWTPDEPEYYLRRAFDGSYAVSGSLFIGEGCAPDAQHIIVYGHNMADGSMFGSLLNYASADYARAHPVIHFDTLSQTGEYRVLAAFYSHAYTSDEEGFRYYRYTDLSAQEEFEAYVRQAKAAALYDTGTAAEYGGRLLTLSTCSYHRENGTFVVVAFAPGELF